MQICHIALYVRDLEKIKDFYAKYFGAVPGSKYRNEKTGFESYFLSFGNGAKIEIMSKPQTERSDEYGNGRLGYDHIAVSAGSKDAVDELTKLLTNDGYTVSSAPRTTGDGYYESCVLDPEGNRVEITV
jgi:lactoylglutathione lyase